MIPILAVLVVALGVMCVVLPFVNWARIGRLREQIEVLERAVARLERERDAAVSMDAEDTPNIPVSSEPEFSEFDESTDEPMEFHEAEGEREDEASRWGPPPIPVQTGASSAYPASSAEFAQTADSSEFSKTPEPEPVSASVPPPLPQSPPPLRASPSEPSSSALASESRASESREGNWVARLSIWVGGVALLFAGMFLIQFSIDSGWLTPGVRLAFSCAFATALCVCGILIHARSQSSNGQRVGQALSGAGVAVYYFAAYAAVHVWGFVGQGVGFGLMLGVTLFALGLSLMQGAPIAVMGLLGGFLTPLLMGSQDPDMNRLLLYLFVLYASFQVLFYQKRWSGLVLLSTLVLLVWSVALQLGLSIYGDFGTARALMSFIAGICLLNGLLFLKIPVSTETTQGEPGTRKSIPWSLRLAQGLSWSIALVQSVVLLQTVEFARLEVALFALIAVALVVLARLRPHTMRWGSWVGVYAIVFTLVAWDTTSRLEYGLWAIGLAGVLCALGIKFAWSQNTTEQWWRFVGQVALLFPLAAYANSEWVRHEVSVDSWQWLGLAVAVSVALLGVGRLILRTMDVASPAVARIRKHYALIGLSLTLLALFIAENVLVGAGLAMLLQWITITYWQKHRLTSLSTPIKGIVLVWLANAGEYLIDTGWVLFGFPNLYEYEAWQATLTESGLVFLITAWMGYVSVSAYRGTDRLSAFFRIQVFFAILMGALVAVGLGWTALDSRWTDWIAFESVATALLWAVAVVVFIVAQRNHTLLKPAQFIAGIALYRLLVLHGIVKNVWLQNIDIGNVFFLNLMSLQYGVAFVALAWIAKTVHASQNKEYTQLWTFFATGIGFVWFTFLVRDYYTSSQMAVSAGGNAEFYSYSVVWLVYGAICQTLGLRLGIRSLNTCALVVFLLAIVKVFIFDAAELEGLLRVFSFMGLGLSLIAIGYFYNRFVLGRQK